MFNNEESVALLTGRAESKITCACICFLHICTDLH